MMDIALNYGKSTLSVPLPEHLAATIIRKKLMPILADPVSVLEDAFAKPIGGKPLVEVARNANRACILICDITRPVPNGVILAPLLRTLLSAGMKAENISILVATGLHRPNIDAELLELVGDRWVVDNFHVENHFARDNLAHVNLGFTRSGTVVKLDRRFVESDLRIVTGLVEPHFMAGWSGGRKVIAPGIAHADTITTFHSARFMEHPNCDNCVLDENPLHEELLEIVDMIGGAHAINLVIDESRNISLVNFGEIKASHLEAVEFMRNFAQINSPKRYSTVVTSAAGYPLDKTYYQTIKGMVGALGILQEGGTLIIASACSEGMGSIDYIKSQERLIALGPNKFLSEILGKSYAAIDEWQSEMLLKPLRMGRVCLYTDGLSDEEKSITGVEIIDSITETITQSVEQSNDTNIAIIPEGPYVVPRYHAN